MSEEKEFYAEYPDSRLVISEAIWFVGLQP